ncbi:hypothetical protein ACOMHN_065527 [Nucella lapillus]
MSSTPNDQPATATSWSSNILGCETSTLVMAAAVVLASLYALLQHRASRQYPPGPRGFPLLGYLDILWSADRRKLLSDLRSEYGDVYSFRLGSRLVVVVSGLDALKRVFVQQGSSFVGRPQVFAVIHGGQGKGSSSSTSTALSSQDSWQEHHQFTLNTLKTLTIGQHSFEAKIQEELEALCSVLDDTKGTDTDPANVLHSATANIIFAIAFGKRLGYDDPALQRFLSTLEENMSLSAGSALEYFFPFLRLVPGDLLKRQKVQRNMEFLQTHLRQWVDAAKRRFDPSDVGDFMDAYFKEMEEAKKKNIKGGCGLGYDQLQHLVGELMVVGTEYTATTLRWLLVFLLRWPHVQRKLRQEIDSLYPDKATPSAQDRHHMPYVEATLMECHRYADVCPFSLARTAANSDTKGAPVEVGSGHHVPQGALVVPNLYSLNHDITLWEEPQNFVPERFMVGEGEVTTRPEHLLPFSFGKRCCPGEELGRLELFLFLTTLLQRYEIRPASKGKLPSLDGHFGMAYSPYSYKVRFVRRDQPEEEEEEGNAEDQGEEGGGRKKEGGGE